LGKSLKIVFACAKVYWARKMSRCRFEYAKAVAARPDVEMLFTGPGFEGYDGDASIGENLKRMGFEPQVVWGYKCHEMSGFSDLKCLKTEAFNEANWEGDRAASECLDSRVDLVICHHHNDLWRFKKHGLECVHIPHCVNLEIFKPGGLNSERPIELLLTGVVSKEIYPLRARFAAMLDPFRKVLNGEIRRHPGYRLRSEGDCDAQFADYAAHLRRARGALCCSSIHKYALAKYAEAFGSSCVVFGDLPDDPVFCEAFGKLVVPLSIEMSDQEMVSAINRVLEEPEGMNHIAAAARAKVESGFTVAHYSTKFLQACRERL
jgi:hypothetical protein